MSARMKRVEVQWVDSIAIGLGWAPRSEYIDVANERRGMRQTTVGLLVHKTKRYLLLALSRQDTGTRITEVMAIPRSAVLRIRRLR